MESEKNNFGCKCRQITFLGWPMVVSWDVDDFREVSTNAEDYGKVSYSFFFFFFFFFSFLFFLIFFFFPLLSLLFLLSFLFTSLPFLSNFSITGNGLFQRLRRYLKKRENGRIKRGLFIQPSNLLTLKTKSQNLIFLVVDLLLDWVLLMVLLRFFFLFFISFPYFFLFPLLCLLFLPFPFPFPSLLFSSLSFLPFSSTPNIISR